MKRAREILPPLWGFMLVGAVGGVLAFWAGGRRG